MILRIITLNTWQERGPWQERWEIIFEELKKYDADIVGLQEVFNMDFAAEIHKRSGYPSLVTSGQNSGLVFLSKHQAVESECLTYVTKSNQEDYFRYALYALFDVAGKKIAAFNTHLSWKLNDDQIRLEQVKELNHFIRKKAMFWGLAWKYPAFLMGDFNSEANKPAVKAVLKEWVDTYNILNPNDLGLTWDNRNPFAARASDRMPERRIDYIFCGPTLRNKVRSSKIVFNQPNGWGTFASDHFGVMTEIEL